MSIDKSAVPYYVLLVDEHMHYKLNERREIIGEPSDDLIAFAKANGTRFSVDVSAWDRVAKDLGLSPIERERHCCYLLIKGQESDDELQRLIDM